MTAVSDVQFTVTDAEAGTRLDVLLVRRAPVFSRKTAMAAISTGDVRVDGRRVKKSYVVIAGNVVLASNAPAERVFHALPNLSLPLQILFEDNEVVVVNKPSKQPTHPLAAEETETLANALVARYPEMADVGYDARQPGILHRLDNDTSGILLAARTRESFERLREDLVGGEITKNYLALVEGRISAGRVIDAPLMPHPRDKKRMQVCDTEFEATSPGARSAVTRVDRVETVAGMSLVLVTAPTARRHQIRVHLASIGHPLVGDLLYGGPSLAGLSRHFLHASAIAFSHPQSDQRVSFEAPLPDELVRITREIGFDDAVVRSFSSRIEHA